MDFPTCFSQIRGGNVFAEYITSYVSIWVSGIAPPFAGQTPIIPRVDLSSLRDVQRRLDDPPERHVSGERLGRVLALRGDGPRIDPCRTRACACRLSTRSKLSARSSGWSCPTRRFY